MVNKVIISTDCVCDLPEKLVEKYNIPMMYYYMQVGEARFQDINEINSDGILEYMVAGKHNIRSMSATVEEYKEFFNKVSDAGKRTVIHIAIAKFISAGYRNAVTAAKEFPDIYVIDSGMVSGALGALVLVAADMGQKGATKEVILKRLDTLKGKINCSFVMRSAQCLGRHGRMAKFWEKVGNAFALHPFIGLKNSTFSLIGFCVGNHERCVTSYMNRCMKDKKKVSDEVLFVITAGCDYEVQKYILSEVQKRMVWKNIYVIKPSATISCNSGSGTFGLVFFTNNIREEAK